MPLILPGNVASATAAVGYDVANSCRFNAADSAELTLTPTAGNQKTWTFSCWVKRSTVGVTDGTYSIIEAGHGSTPWFVAAFNNDEIHIAATAGSSASWETTAVFRDVAAWYHVVLVLDTTSATSSISSGSTDRIRVYVNGVQQTIAGGTVPTQNADLQWSSNVGHHLFGASYGQFFPGYVAEVVFIDGTALAPTSFGEFNEDSPTIWQPIDVSGLTFGDEGYYLDFEDSGNLGDDESGNTNDWAEANLAATDQATDSPTNNFCTLNPLASSIDTTNNVIKEGNLIVDHGDAAYDGGTATFGFLGSQGGKWYWEIEVNADSASANQGEFAGINMANEDHGTVYDAFGTESYLLATTGSNIIYKKDNSAVFTLTDPAGFSAGDHINVALDLDNNKIWFGLNGTYYDMADGSADGDPAGNSDGAAVSRDYDYLPYYRIYGASAKAMYNFVTPSLFIPAFVVRILNPLDVKSQTV